jgi:hypothetical protein
VAAIEEADAFIDATLEQRLQMAAMEGEGGVDTGRLQGAGQKVSAGEAGGRHGIAACHCCQLSLVQRLCAWCLKL